jgi:maleylacetate reductase
MNPGPYGQLRPAMPSFAFQQPLVSLTFGAGSLAKLPAVLEVCGIRRPLLVPTPSQRTTGERVAAMLPVAGHFAGVAPHVPAEAVTALAAQARETGADGLIALGGGAAIDLAKAASAGTKLPVIAVPTTYGGSELTAHAGRTSGRAKEPVASGPPRGVIYDPELTLELPARASAGSAMNALAHCIEALYAPKAQPLALLAAEEALRRMPAALRAVARDLRDAAGREELLYGGYLAGVALAGSGMALHHRICHVLGGRYGIAHGDANAVILPHAVRFNAPAAPETIARAGRALGVPAEDVADALADLARACGAATSLRELGLEHGELEAVADGALAAPMVNPRPVDRAELLELLEAAWSGRLAGVER